MEMSDKLHFAPLATHVLNLYSITKLIFKFYAKDYEIFHSNIITRQEN